MPTELIFDCETKKLFSDTVTGKPEDLGVSIVSAYFRTVDTSGKELKGTMQSFWEADFPNLFTLFTQADRIIGFNSKSFDVPALSPYTTLNLSGFNHLDILEKFRSATGRRISLNSLASANIGTGKIDHGTNAVIYWKSGDPESLGKLKMYCEADVAITRDLYDFVVKNKYVSYMDTWNSPIKVPLDFSYPPPPATQQIGLF